MTEDYLVDRGLIWNLEADSSRKPKEVPTWEQILKSVDPSRAQESDGDAEDEIDDDSKMLIQQIVERTKVLLYSLTLKNFCFLWINTTLLLRCHAV